MIEALLQLTFVITQFSTRHCLTEQFSTANQATVIVCYSRGHEAFEAIVSISNQRTENNSKGCQFNTCSGPN